MRAALLAKRGGDIRAMFGRIAHRYDLLNRVLSVGLDRRWRRHLAARVAAASPAVVLDVCTGTGDVALALPSAPLVIGSDFCLPMLARARQKAARRRRRLPLAVADALALPVAAATVDVVTVAFGVRNFENRAAGLTELVRVLRPGGVLLVLEFSQPEGLLAPLLGWWARTVPPRLGRWLSGDGEAYSYLPASVSSFPSGAAMCRELTAAGLVEVSARPLTHGVATLYEGRRPARAGERTSHDAQGG